jgi:PIN domain
LKTNHVLIDYENVQVKSLELLQGEHFRVYIFLGTNNTKLSRDLAVTVQAMGARAQYVELSSSGPNALDFYISYYLGQLVLQEPLGFFHIISKDKGFDPLVEHLKTRSILSARSTIDAMPCFAVKPITDAVTAAVPLPAEEVKPVAPIPPKPLTNKKAVLHADQVQLALHDLVTRKSNKPATLKTLLNTIHARIGKDRPIAEAQAVRDALVQRKYVSVNGLKVTYKLPKIAEKQ